MKGIFIAVCLAAFGMGASAQTRPEKSTAEKKTSVRHGKINNPLYILNGEVSTQAITSKIDPDDIESVTVLKDAATIARYGNEAKAGVVVVNTKTTGTTVQESPVLKREKTAGNGELTVAPKPLYILDGEVSTQAITSNLNPDDIESVTVLKDPASTAIYGEKARSGVIVVKTKNKKTFKL